MHRFQGCKASLESLCINFGGELSTIATLMFAMLYVLLNNLVRSLIFHWVYTILFIQNFLNFHQIRMISTLVHNFKLNFHNFVHFMTSNLETNLDDLYICKVEFYQPSCWLYSMPNLLVFQQLVTLYLGGIPVRVVSEIVWRNAQECARKTGTRDWISRVTRGYKSPEAAHVLGMPEVEASCQLEHYRTK